MPHATIRDVARVAEVSVASVSRVLNGHANIRDAMRLKVEEAARQLGYVPHAGARNLSLSRSGAIGVVLPDLHGEFFSELLRGMDEEAAARGLHLLLTVMNDRPGRGTEALQAMRGRVDGLAIMAPHIAADELVARLPAGIPAVLLNCALRTGPHTAMRVDNVSGAEAMIDHLVATGRRRIVHIAGPATNIDAIERRRGVEQAAARAGLPVRIIEGNFLQDAGIAAATTVLADPSSVDAIFAANDMMALGAIVTLRRAGIAVPDQIAVAGFDDIPLARLVSPLLTTVRIDIAAMGQRAVASLDAAIAADARRRSAAKARGPAAPSAAVDRDTDMIVPSLVIRESTAQPSLKKGHNAGEYRT